MGDARYIIRVWNGGSWGETWWDWSVCTETKQDEPIAMGNYCNTRWGARRAAKLAARRHARGLPITKPPKPNEWTYVVPASEVQTEQTEERA